MATTKNSAGTKPKALICGMLEIGGKVLFLAKNSKDGKEVLEMPFVMGSDTTDPHSQLAEAFKKQTGIKAHPVHQVMEGKHNVGTPKNPEHIPVLVFEMMPDEPRVKPDPGKGYTGFFWLKMIDAEGKALSENAGWLLEEPVMIDD